MHRSFLKSAERWGFNPYSNQVGFWCPAGKMMVQREACRVPAQRGLPGHLALFPASFPTWIACSRKQGRTQCCLPSHLLLCLVLPVGVSIMGGEEKISLPLSILGHLFLHGSAIQPPRTAWQSRRRTCPRRGAMVSYGKRLACLLVGGAVYPAVFLLSVLIQYGGTVFPPGIDQPLKARICQTMFITGLMLVRFSFNPFFMNWDRRIVLIYPFL